MIDALTRFIADELLSGRRSTPLGADDELLESGLLDSLGVMQLVWFLEEEFGVQVPPEDVTLEHFRSVARIAAYLESSGGPRRPSTDARSATGS